MGARDEPTRRHAIEQVIAGVNHTAHLAQQLLTLARLEHAGAEARQMVDLGTLAADCVARRAGDATDKGIDLELATEPDCALQGDRATLGVLVDNLLDNSIKYGKAGGRIVVGVGRAANDMSLTVADDGARVADADRARLRDRFFRVKGQIAPGSGLGLSMVERIVAAHDGAVDIGTGLDGRGLAVTARFKAGPWKT